MLLTLSANSLSRRIGSTGPLGLDLLDLPAYAREHLDLYGLQISASMLAGAESSVFDRLRDRADKAGCPCLLLSEDDPQPLSAQDGRAEAAMERMDRVIRGAHKLGCNAVAFAIEARDDATSIENVAERMKHVMERAERLELNLLIAPRAGLTADPERLATLIKKIGGFRIGSLPDFETAANTGDAAEYLRRVTPYASSVVASTRVFDDAGVHEPYDLRACLESVMSVGYDGALAIDYRGKGDPVEGVKRTRDALLAALEAPEP
ncbi:MAG: sugar phosphate isomerase/epimerase [Phycisphaerales bacterium]|nr:MAG: sugar phosphate isomerase/epimerase [Phycisphaerales bacterium]